MICGPYLRPKVLDDAPELLDALQKRAGLPWAEIARQAGVSERTLHKWRRGEGEPDLSDFGRIAETCGVGDIYALAEMIEGKRTFEIESATLRIIEEKFGREFGAIYARAIAAEAERDQLRAELDKLKG